MTFPYETPVSRPTGIEQTSTAVLSVSALNRLAREALETALPLLWVGGEISNLTRAASGHLYFTLKDANAQVRCAMWRNKAQLLAFRPQNGMRVEARALVTLYEARGDYQLNIESLRPAGIGSLFEAFNRLKEKLAAEGLFDAAGRRPLPRLPRAIGVVTSAQAAALRDVIITLRRRAPHVPIIVFPTPVQGPDAGPGLLAALDAAAAHAAQASIDVVLLVRGGGSIEDLWAFNDETLARALRASRLPVVCGVGHETDVTIADFAADLRAPTPTGAAELVTEGWHAMRSTLPGLDVQLQRAMIRRLEALGQRLDRAALQLKHPRARMADEAKSLQGLGQRLSDAMRRRLAFDRLHAAHVGARLRAAVPRLAQDQRTMDALAHRLRRSLQHPLTHQRQRTEALAASLQHLAPEAVLERGYAIARDTQGRVLRHAAKVPDGATVSVQLAHGSLATRVTGHQDD